ncbi:MAG TPA: nucleotidyl transferase [Verrucomicrobiales bacterium]|nr:nucleotidyl transferase [Verrucomicrobiales bacterium]|tara:strand:- start:1783 stop:2532 length:750 start_codon:yes stop_codon:yes gene_type:complete
MKAVILAAGKGTRMGELTEETPKPMLPVEGRPILEHIISGLREVGVSEFCVITGWKAEVIEDYFGDGTDLQVAIQYVRQRVQDGTGKAPELAKEFVGDSPFLLTYGDILVKADTYQQMLVRWAEGEFSGLVTVTGSEDVTKGGLFFFDQEFRLQHLVEKPSVDQLADLRASGLLKPGEPGWYNAGIYCFNPVIFKYTAQLNKSSRGEYELTDALEAMLSEEHILAGLAIAGRWVDVRDPEVLRDLQGGC